MAYGLPANFPPTMAADMIGSVGVRHAAIARHEIVVNFGNRARIIPATITQPIAMVGTTIVRSPLTCFAM